MGTPVPRILLAMEGKTRFVRISAGLPAEEPEPVDPTPDQLNAKLRAWMRSHQ